MNISLISSGEFIPGIEVLNPAVLAGKYEDHKKPLGGL